MTDSNLYDITYMKYKKTKDETPSGEKSEGQERELEKDASRFSYFAWRLKMNQTLDIHTFYCMQIILQLKKKKSKEEEEEEPLQEITDKSLYWK